MPQKRQTFQKFTFIWSHTFCSIPSKSILPENISIRFYGNMSRQGQHYREMKMCICGVVLPRLSDYYLPVENPLSLYSHFVHMFTPVWTGMLFNIIGPSGLCALSRNKVSTINGIFSLSFVPGYFSARRGYRRVRKFCMRFKVTKKIRFEVRTKLGSIFYCFKNTKSA